MNARSKFRFLLVSLIPNKQSSGMGKWTYRIAEQLDAAGHKTEMLFQDDFRWYSCLGRFGFIFSPWLLGLELARRCDSFDVAVVHEPAGLGYAVLRNLAPSLPPLIVMCHNVESHVAKTMRRASRAGWTDVRLRNVLSQVFLRRPLTDGAIQLADHVVCLSQRDSFYLTRQLRKSGKRVSVMINGVAPEYLAVPHIAEATGRVLFVGGWLDIKGRRILPRIWDIVATNNPKSSLTVVGTGVASSNVLADFSEAVRSRVTVIPSVATDLEMIALYRSHDVLLMPSLSEGSPLSVLEAMGAGLPVVCSAVGGIPDIVVDRETGLLFNPGNVASAANAVSEILTTPALRNRLRHSARSRAELYNWRSSAMVLERIADSILSKGHTSY
jgi:glycosyltransferase involved in cell wall biosynthesis